MSATKRFIISLFINWFVSQSIFRRIFNLAAAGKIISFHPRQKKIKMHFAPQKIINMFLFFLKVKKLIVKLNFHFIGSEFIKKFQIAAKM